jgi:predicted transcriptional regulator YdeE
VSFELREESGQTILGIHARASNAEPEKIGDLWRRFHTLGGVAAIESRLDDTVYGVYCEYEGDATGPYTALIGCSVDADVAVPEGLKKINLTAGKFVVWEVSGDLPKALWDAWAEIWKMPLDRRYEADFDRYGSDGKVTVHVGVR